MMLSTSTGLLLLGLPGLQELILITLFAIGIVVIPLPGRLFGRGKHTIAGGKPLRWSGKFHTVQIEAIHTAAEAFFCSYSNGEYTIAGREQFRLTFHRGPWQDQGGGQLLPIAYAGAGAGQLPVILRVVMQPQRNGLLITVRHEVIPADKLSRTEKKDLTARFKGEVAAFKSYLTENFIPPGQPDRRPRKRISVIQRDE